MKKDENILVQMFYFIGMLLLFAFGALLVVTSGCFIVSGVSQSPTKDIGQSLATILAGVAIGLGAYFYFRYLINLGKKDGKENNNKEG